MNDGEKDRAKERKHPAKGRDASSFVFFVCCAGGGLCNELIIHSEVSYGVSV